MSLCKIYPSGCGNKGSVGSVGVHRLLIASNDNRATSASVAPETAGDQQEQHSNVGLPDPMEGISLVPFGYIEAGAQDISMRTLAISLSLLLLVFGANAARYAFEFISVSIGESEILHSLTRHWPNGM